jgi:hypothetical protein
VQRHMIATVRHFHEFLEGAPEHVRLYPARFLAPCACDKGHAVASKGQSVHWGTEATALRMEAEVQAVGSPRIRGAPDLEEANSRLFKAHCNLIFQGANRKARAPL